jgi:hypothetical protein
MPIDPSKVHQLLAIHQFFQSTILNCHQIQYLLDLKGFRFNFLEFPPPELSDFHRTVSEVKFDSKMIQYNPID